MSPDPPSADVGHPLTGLRKRFGSVVAVDTSSLDVQTAS